MVIKVQGVALHMILIIMNHGFYTYKRWVRGKGYGHKKHNTNTWGENPKKLVGKCDTLHVGRFGQIGVEVVLE